MKLAIKKPNNAHFSAYLPSFYGVPLLGMNTTSFGFMQTQTHNMKPSDLPVSRAWVGVAFVLLFPDSAVADGLVLLAGHAQLPHAHVQPGGLRLPSPNSRHSHLRHTSVQPGLQKQLSHLHNSHCAADHAGNTDTFGGKCEGGGTYYASWRLRILCKQPESPSRAKPLSQTKQPSDRCPEGGPGLLKAIGQPTLRRWIDSMLTASGTFTDVRKWAGSVFYLQAFPREGLL